MKHSLVPYLLAAGVALGTLAGCQRGGDPPAASEPPTVAVRARTLKLRVFDEVVTAEGRWRSTGEIVITAPFAGGVDSLLVQLGDQVAAGQTLCRLVTREAQAALRGAALLAAEAHDGFGRDEADRAAELARRELVRVPLSAPRAGTVVRLSTATGGGVAESAELMAILPADAIVFEAHVSSAEAPRLRIGQRATIEEEGHPARAAALQRILPAAGAGDQSTLVWLRAMPDGAPPVLDRFGTALITVGAQRRALAVPDSAVVQDDLTGETRIALVTPGGQAVWTRATLGLGSAGWHELVAPVLTPGSQVIIDGHRGLPDSTRVKVTG
jgi:multidrug efflux pump subunit AcrA (membrane-fusion protein)